MRERINDVVSIIILHFNQPEYLYYAIDSVLFQNYQYIELIISDDHSTLFDPIATEAYIAQNKRDNIVHSRIRINEENLGTVKNINAALSEATGRFIKIFAADDALYDSTVIEKQVKDICEHGLLITTGLLCQRDTEMNTKEDVSVNKNNSNLRNLLNMTSTKRERFIYRHNLFPYITQSMMFRMEFFKHYGKYSEDYLLIEDTPMMWKIIDKDIQVGLTNSYVIKHRGDVGVTGRSKKNPKSSLYYLDCIKMLKEKKERNIGWVNKLDCIIQIRLFKLRKELPSCDKQWNRWVMLIRTIPAAIVYMILHPVRFSRMIFNK